MNYVVAIASLGSDTGWFFVCFGLIALYGGIRTVVVRDTGKMRGKTGRLRRFTGRDAVIYGVLTLIVGAGFLIVGIFNLV
jgi:hypothetical protein